jgi:class 3 adenylate cyclase
LLYLDIPEDQLKPLGLSESKRLNEAETIALKSLKTCDEIGFQEGKMYNYELLSRVYEKQGKHAMAHNAFKKFVSIKDSIQGEEVSQNILRKDMQFEFDRKETQLKYENQLSQEKLSRSEQEVKTKNAQRNLFIGGTALMLLLASSIFVGLKRTAKEKKRSEELLLNILPEEVAEELKAKGEAEARLIEEVTVLFTDFKGFTALSEQLTPKELVKDLHECFTAFDNIMQKHGLEKIKTIGDAYMAAGGVPTPNTTHAVDVVMAALEIRQFMEEGKAKKISNQQPYFEIRIGVHTGPVVAGIVGVKKFSYDIWGDTVNTAARMESSGETGKVNISATTYNLVKEKFVCVHRGKVQAKGKGEIDMYFVEKPIQ